MDNCIDSKEQYSDSDFDHNFGYLGGKIRFWRCAAASYCLSVHLGGGEKPMRGDLDGGGWKIVATTIPFLRLTHLNHWPFINVCCIEYPFLCHYISAH